MPDEELVNAYVEGRISRRVFIRRLVAGGIGLGAALTYAEVLGASAASAKTPGGEHHHQPPPPGRRHHHAVT